MSDLNIATETLSMENIADLRRIAEGHLDKAQQALFDDDVTEEDALAELDAALACLNTMINN